MTVNPNKTSTSSVSSEENKDKKSRIIRYAGLSNFTHINNACINDENISDSALGVLIYVLSKPADWVIYVSQLCKRFNRSKSKMYSIIDELINLGYMRRRQERHPTKGYVIGWITEAADYPVFLQPQGVLLDPNLQEVVKTRSCKTNATNTNKNKLLKDNKTKPISVPAKSEPQKPSQQTDLSVVALMEKIKQWAIAETLLRSWLEKHGAEYVMEKIELTTNQAIENPAGFLNKAIANDWKKHLSNESKHTPNPEVQKVYPTMKENKKWYFGLSDDQKQACYEHATNKHSGFRLTLKDKGIDYRSAEFLETTWFKQMMELIGRSK